VQQETNARELSFPYAAFAAVCGDNKQPGGFWCDKALILDFGNRSWIFGFGKTGEDRASMSLDSNLFAFPIDLAGKDEAVLVEEIYHFFEHSWKTGRYELFMGLGHGSITTEESSLFRNYAKRNILEYDVLIKYTVKDTQSRDDYVTPDGRPIGKQFQYYHPEFAPKMATFVMVTLRTIRDFR
jgi:hypothetical protein